MKRAAPDERDERDRIRRSFLCMALCHELKQPLHSLNLNVELLAKRLGPAAASPEIGGPIAAFGRVVDRVNDSLEAFATRTLPAPVGPERHDLGPVLRRVGERVKVVGAPPPPIPCNLEQIEIALDALVDNALQATRAGGDVFVNVRSDEEEVYIDVVDRGTGMSSNVARHAFEIGFSTWGGDGVGLTIAKFVVYHHSGGFSLSSREGQGTTVSIVLPATGEAAGGTVGD